MGNFVTEKQFEYIVRQLSTIREHQKLQDAKIDELRELVSTLALSKSTADTATSAVWEKLPIKTEEGAGVINDILLDEELFKSLVSSTYHYYYFLSYCWPLFNTDFNAVCVASP